MTPSASEIIERARARYAGCRSYEDEGEHTIQGTRELEPPKTAAFSFRCAFVRAITERDLFLFALHSRENGDRPVLAVWQNRLGTYRNDTSGAREVESVGSGMHASAVLMGMAAQTAGLLMPAINVLPGRAFGFVPLRVQEDEVTGTRCYRLAGSWGDAAATIWVDRESLLFQRAECKRGMGSVRVEETTIWRRARMDHAIPLSVFEFTPPA